MKLMHRWSLFGLVVAFPALDVGTLFLFSRWAGVPLTLALVALSTALGLLACGRWVARIAEHDKAIRAKSGGDLPPEVMVVHGGEAFLSFLAMLLFLFPGFLSDIVGFLLAAPWVQGNFTDKFVELIKRDAALQGKSVEEYLRGKKSCLRT